MGGGDSYVIWLQPTDVSPLLQCQGDPRVRMHPSNPRPTVGLHGIPGCHLLWLYNCLLSEWYLGMAHPTLPWALEKEMDTMLHTADKLMPITLRRKK